MPSSIKSVCWGWRVCSGSRVECIQSVEVVQHIIVEHMHLDSTQYPAICSFIVAMRVIGVSSLMLPDLCP